MNFTTDFATWQRIASFKATTSSDAYRPMLNAISLTVKKGTLTVASTNSYVLAVTRIEVDEATNGAATVKAPAVARSVSQARAVAKDHGLSDRFKSIAKIRDLRVRVELSDDGKRLNATFGDDGLLGVALPIVDGKYPNYEALIPDLDGVELGTKPVAINPDVFRLLGATVPKHGDSYLVMRCQDELKPVVFTSTADPKWIGMAMTIRLASTAEVAA